jgi:hypothetical protein
LGHSSGPRGPLQRGSCPACVFRQEVCFAFVFLQVLNRVSTVF